jgi:hypothetical protein
MQSNSVVVSSPAGAHAASGQFISLVLAALLFVTAPFFPLHAASPSAKKESRAAVKKSSWPIITRKGDHLYEGDKVFRFLGLCAPNIQQNENQVRTDRTNRFPDDYEIRDILGAIQRMGGRATRTFSLSVVHPDDLGMPAYITARRTYNEDAFRCLDRIIALCHEYDVRLIIPFIASQSFRFVRGVDEFSALSNKPSGSFWTDEEVIADYRHFLSFMLNRVNTVNGIAYKDDPAILAWQLGNEFGSFAGDRKLSYDTWNPIINKWSLDCAAFIKSVDPNHLVMEAGGGFRKDFIDDPNIDIISDHLYEYWSKLGGGDGILAPMAKRSQAECKGKKPLIIDEFGLAGIENSRALMQTIIDEDIVGGMIWSIRSHRRDGGWYYHNEGGTPFNSFHVPGSAAGFPYDEIRTLDLLRTMAFKIRGMKEAPVTIPTPAPVLMRSKDGLTWRGSTGAAYYALERAKTANGPWTLIATGLHDGVLQDVKSFEDTPLASAPLTLYVDEGAGARSFYRIRGVNIAGDSELSNILEVQK